MKLLVGCPISNRSWILDDWFQHVIAAKPSSVDLEFVFVVPGIDVEDIEIINQYTDYVRHVILTDETTYKNRGWNADRYDTMVKLRNTLLEAVRSIEPDLFLSVDSDILLAPGSIDNLIETYQSNSCIAVGGKAYLDVSSKFHPSYANWTGQTYRRPDFEGVAKVDIIMAIKLLGPVAYNVDYEFHRNGEDFGFSKAASEYGKLYWDGRVTNKHIMNPKDKDKIDSRCGF